ncbi:unnamed protein product, partial [Rotaria socialis]
EKNDEYRHQLRFQTCHVTDYSLAMEFTIEKFIQHEFMSQHLEYDCQITLVLYHFIDEILKCHFSNENPNIKQVRFDEKQQTKGKFYFKSNLINIFFVV